MLDVARAYLNSWGRENLVPEVSSDVETEVDIRSKKFPSFCRIILDNHLLPLHIRVPRTDLHSLQRLNFHPAGALEGLILQKLGSHSEHRAHFGVGKENLDSDFRNYRNYVVYYWNKIEWLCVGVLRPGFNSL
ncbi:hypothetical protein TNCV_1769431 [Trichonephila clavipes]|nr:hypothetical protein TNCV_1769431 [Trichonephila clavipes]